MHDRTGGEREGKATNGVWIGPDPVGLQPASLSYHYCYLRPDISLPQVQYLQASAADSPLEDVATAREEAHEVADRPAQYLSFDHNK